MQQAFVSAQPWFSVTAAALLVLREVAVLELYHTCHQRADL